MRRAPPLAPWLLAAVLLAGPARAADLHVLAGGDGGGARARLLVTDLRSGDDVLALAAERAMGTTAAALRWRRTLAAGPIGNLVLEGAVGSSPGAPGPAVDAELGARGVVGPVALGVRVAQGRRAPFAWPELDPAPGFAPPVDPRARTGAAPGGPVTGIAASAVWRIDRAWTWGFEPTLARTETGWTGAFATSLRRADVARDVDVALAVDVAFGAVRRHAALGVTLHHVPRRAPASAATVWLGGDGQRLAPGASLAWTVRDGAANATLEAGWGPPWSDRTRGYLGLRASAPAFGGTWSLAVGWVGANGRIELGWTRPLER